MNASLVYLFDDLFNEIFNTPRLTLNNGYEYSPINYAHAKVNQNDDNYTVKLPLAGFSKDHVDISVVDNILTITAENKENEFGNKIVKSWSLPRNSVDQTKIDASLENGVLTVVVPKVKNEDKKKLTIKVK